jgi:peroxiredoxin
VKHYDEIIDNGFKVVAISSDSIEGCIEFKERLKAPFDFLSDEDAKVINEYDMANPIKRESKYFDGEQVECPPRTISLCGNVLISKKDGQVSYQKGSWSIRPTIEDMMQQIRYISGTDSYIAVLKDYFANLDD